MFNLSHSILRISFLKGQIEMTHHIWIDEIDMKQFDWPATIEFDTCWSLLLTAAARIEEHFQIGC